ncbi:hypothetical protein H6G20_18290 [Desertifilum sp. FACHB-1129]|uniref:Uncharacterized protein n=2 Tax=Cyanophyceae TaxID=3028117 RepID=A0A1E5QJG7_9CYAN|nr:MULTISPECIES: hypothetical protein [Cyanophyceae]MCD8486468.1 hypothetical protein [Desertifilum sp.]MDA0210152.1 hypothetical protein [Cyanobacteria bacterium FC1]MDI9639087.1 hypothetical protein [Geitlerinema splendidum]MBD2313621.1 hypothetical protein [Desertifilum sp. FACHB-1129]MBD2320558.1 hypothetical protein [Desertifilum sp. FACHB-866]
MRWWRFWWQTFLQSTLDHPVQCVDLVLSISAVGWLAVWLIEQQWPYLVLGSSYAVGLATTTLVREAIAPSPHAQVVRASALLLLIISICSFVDVAHYL